MEDFFYYFLDNRLFFILLFRVLYILVKENVGLKIRGEMKFNKNYKIFYYCFLNIV